MDEQNRAFKQKQKEEQNPEELKVKAVGDGPSGHRWNLEMWQK